MKHIKNILKKIWEDESGQGATEYILMLVVVVAIALVFKTQITEIIKGKTKAVGEDLMNFNK